MELFSGFLNAGGTVCLRKTRKNLMKYYELGEGDGRKCGSWMGEGGGRRRGSESNVLNGESRDFACPPLLQKALGTIDDLAL